MLLSGFTQKAVVIIESPLYDSPILPSQEPACTALTYRRKNDQQLLNGAEYHLKNNGDRVGCYLAETDNILRDLN